MPEKRLRKWNPLRLFKSKGKAPKDSYLEKPEYAKYRRDMARDPETILNTLSFEKWRKTRKGIAKPK